MTSKVIVMHTVFFFTAFVFKWKLFAQTIPFETFSFVLIPIPIFFLIDTNDHGHHEDDCGFIHGFSSYSKPISTHCDWCQASNKLSSQARKYGKKLFAHQSAVFFEHFKQFYCSDSINFIKVCIGRCDKHRPKNLFKLHCKQKMGKWYSQWQPNI